VGTAMATLRLLIAILALAAHSRMAYGQTQQWGTIKGQMVFGGETLPERPVINAALPIAKVYSEELVVDPRTKGVRWAMVWLLDEKGGNNIPIHRALKAVSEKIVVDQSNCQFEPHALCLREGQTLVIKNSSKINHPINPCILGVDSPANVRMIRPGDSEEVIGWKASPRPLVMGCSIHKWMTAYIRVFTHPYFAVTNERGEFEIKNAPAGSYRIVIWQESVGWVVREGEKNGKYGIPIEIKPEATLDIGKIKLMPE
jgi:hypothetical protein